jgi:hypothetical protein
VVCQWGVVAAAGEERIWLPSTLVKARAITVESAMKVSPRSVRMVTSSTQGRLDSNDRSIARSIVPLDRSKFTGVM